MKNFFQRLDFRGARSLDCSILARGRRAQASIEYLSVIAFTLGALIVVWLYVSSQTNSTSQALNVAYAKQVVLKLRDAADLVYAQGPPARFVVEVNVPEGVEYADASGKEILLRVRNSGGLTDVFASTVANLTGNLSAFERSFGLMPVTVVAQRQSLGNVVVNITA
ncbi:MAG: hypothetical protein V1817_04475 [Candidatus Micrarchaeota archaeon]